ncbi:sigma-70 family RNA polymerase sigma factor [Streptomyces qinzhouensis]|uniref:Sigma-70 family RNA polymerase sigma factor n=1 Tax=Streptomyces qinzhouensis TaxID=2599401 RepID=A0A5B8J8R0_9ACTN|nr:sigma-70 family RNA polymerase sigma factor [Streptomyces qinzhouensis]QDY77646.1 sigma-70 family RNA polymerase sigma factor [Streptomyces qinzhouensis]
MSGDGRGNAPGGGAEDAEGGALPPRQVPEQFQGQEPGSGQISGQVPGQGAGPEHASGHGPGQLSGQVPEQGGPGGLWPGAAWGGASARGDQSTGTGGGGPSVPAQGTSGVRADDAEDVGWADAVPGAGGPSGATRTGGSGAGGSAAGGESHAVPSQREGGASGSVLPPPREVLPSDADLIARMRAGDDGAYEELFRRHSEAVRRYARTCCRDSHTADDLTAEVFARTLQAVRSGAGPEYAVRAYLMTTVRRTAATWTNSAKREQLVEDFALFATEAAGSAEGSPDRTTELGADVRAMHEAERSLAMQAFRSLPERWQAVLWHTTVEEESPSEVAPLFGLTANATAVLASRAREGLKQAYLQAHVSSALTSGGDCARYADRLGAYARGGLRMRAERGLRKHLEECAKCRLAAGELKQVNAGIPALLPVAVIGWFAAGYSLKAAGVVAGGAVGAAGAGAAAAATGAGTAGGAGAGAAAGGAAASEGLGAPVKVGIGAALAVATAAGLVWAFAGDPEPAKPAAKPSAARSVTPVPQDPKPPAPKPRPAPVVPEPERPAPKPVAKPTPKPKQRPKPAPTPSEARPKPRPKPPVVAPSEPTPTPPRVRPKPTPKPPAAPRDYQLNRLKYSVFGDGTEPEIAVGESSWLWQRWGLRIGGQRYEHGVTVRSRSSVTINLNRPCTSYEAMAGVDDLTLGRGAMTFSVFADGVLLWRSPVLRGDDPAVPVQIPLTGREKLRLVVEPHSKWDGAALGSWAASKVVCQ